MNLECANGKVYQNIDADTLKQALGALNPADNDFATLNSEGGKNFPNLPPDLLLPATAPVWPETPETGSVR